MAITISGTDGIVGAGFTVDNSGVSVTAGVGTFSSLQGSGANLTALTAANLTGALPAISAANCTNIPAANITGTLPAISATNLTNIPAANITGTLPAISGANLTGIDASKVKQTTYNSTTTTFSSSSSSFVETPCNITITPTVSSSKIIVQLSPAIWSASGQYVHLEVRASGGASGVIMSFGDFYTGYYGNTLLQGVHTGHNTTSAITYTIWGRSDGAGWYCPNNNNDSDIDQRYTGICWEVTA